MPVFVVLLRAVNVGGTGKLPMGDLKQLCEKAGFQNVRTYIASGNVVAERDGAEARAKAALEAELRAYAGKPVGVIIRTAAEMARVVADNPFPDRPASRTVAIFLDHAPPPDALKNVKGQADEELRLGAREIYVHYPDGIGRSKLRIPAAGDGTGGFRREVQHRRQHWFLNEKSGFPFRTPAFCSVSRGRRRLGEKEYRAPSVTPGVALRPRTQAPPQNQRRHCHI
jgi:uncharacterized protein (DUF1697 family)